MQITTKIIIAASLGLALLVGVVLYGMITANTAGAEVSFKSPMNTSGEYVYYNFFTGTTTSATSTDTSDGGGYFLTAGAKSLTFYFSRGWGAGNTGTSRFEVEGSPDGTNWYDLNHLLTNDVSDTGTSTISISASTSTSLAHLDLNNKSIFAIRCIVNEVTDGSHTCKAAAEF